MPVISSADIPDQLLKTLVSMHERVIGGFIMRILDNTRRACCDNPEHRIKPRDADDWRAIDNHMWVIVHGAFRSFEEQQQILMHAMMPSKDGILAEDAKELVDGNIMTTASMLIVKAHITLREKADGDKDARNYHDRLTQTALALLKNGGDDGCEAGKSH